MASIKITAFTQFVAILTVTGVIGIASVRAEPAEPNAQQTRASEQWSEKARVNEQNRRLTQNNKAKRGDRMVCKQEPILGTRLKGMVNCRTASEWRRVARGFQAELKRTNDKAALAYSTN